MARRASKPDDSSTYYTMYESETNNRVYKDMWRTLRRFLDDGYTLIGDFQDLDHAHIRYTDEELLQFQREVWDWNDSFLTFVDEHEQAIMEFLSHPCPREDEVTDHVGKSKKSVIKTAKCRFSHAKSSHLFWGWTPIDDLPDGKTDLATTALGYLGRSQLKRASTYLENMMAYDHVIPETSNESNLSKNVIMRAEGLEDIVHETYHNLRKELRSFFDELDLFGILLLPDYSSLPDVIGMQPSAGSTTNDASYSDVAPSTSRDSYQDQQVDDALEVLKRTRKLLGDMNDDYAAYSTYVKKDEYPVEQLRLSNAIEDQWSSFRSWAEEVDLRGKIEFLRARMAPRSKPIKTSSTEPNEHMLRE